jgi:starch phosphorylase
MKILVNGGLNLSELDGWWAEAYSPEVGWAIGDGKEHGDDPAFDASEAQSLYDLLEHEVIPRFYARDEQGVPRGWTAMMRESMSRLTPQFSASRSVREYTEKYYLPLAERYLKRAAAKGALAKQIVKWEETLASNWSKIHFGQASVESANGLHQFGVQLYLNGIDSNAVRVEICAEGAGRGDPERIPMERVAPLSACADGYLYGARVSSVIAPGCRPCARRPTTPFGRSHRIRMRRFRTKLAVLSGRNDPEHWISRFDRVGAENSPYDRNSAAI